MLGRRAVQFTVMVMVLSVAALAQGQDKIQNYFSDAASKVKAATDPAQKRELLSKSFDNMATALKIVQSSPLVSDADKAGIERYKVSLGEKQDELAGINGFEPVPDAQLNSFASYVVQDMEQAAQSITISVVTLLLIIIIVILLL